MNVADIRKFITEQGDAPDNFILRTVKEDEIFLENFRQGEVEKKVLEIHEGYEKDIKDVTGLAKRPREHTYDFNKRLLTELKTKADKADEIEAENVRLKETQTKGGDPSLIADLENVRKEFTEYKTQKDQEVEKLAKEHKHFKADNVIRGAANAFEYDPAVPESLLSVYKDKVISELVAIADEREGNTVFLDEKGIPLRNKEKSLAPYTAEELVYERMKDVIKQKRVITGVKIPEVVTKVTALPDNVTTKEQLSTWLMSQGKKRGTPEYDEAYKEMRVGLPDGY